MEKLLCVTILLAVPPSFGQQQKVLPCGLPEDIGPCRYTEPCKPTLLAWNDTFIIVSWEGLFEGCHGDQINGMYIKRSEGKYLYIHNNINFSENKSYLERKYCDNSEIGLRIDFNEDHVIVNAHNVQQRDLHTHYNDCENIITNKSNEAIIGGVSGGKLLPLMSLLIIKSNNGFQ